MANEENNIVQGLLDGIEYLIDSKLQKSPNDKTFRGKIVNVDGVNLYSVTVNGKTYNNIKSLAKATLSVNDIVYVVFPQNNPSNMFILNTGGGDAPPGTTDYAQLTNKPSINGVELIGNKTLSQLGTQPAGNYVLDSDLSTVAKTGNYNDLTNKPNIVDTTYTLDTSESVTNGKLNLIGSDGVTKTVNISGSGATKISSDNVNTITISSTDTTYQEATPTTEGLMSSADKAKLNSIENGAQVNTIETVQVNGVSLTPTNKVVNVTVPTKNSQLTNDSGFLTAIPSEYVTDAEMQTYAQPKGDYATNTALSAETTNRQTQDNVLQQNIDNVNNKVDNLQSIQILNKGVITSTIANVQSTCTNYITTEYSRQPKNLDGLIVTFTDSAPPNDKVQYVYSGFSNIWVDTGTAQTQVSEGSKTEKGVLQVGNGINVSSGIISTDKTTIGLGNVNNTSDINKPISTATQNALNLKANISDLAPVATSGNYNDLIDKPTSLPASDVYSWAKQPNKPTYTSSEVGLGNVPDVTTNNQTPTWTIASALANLVSGETLSIAFGKIAKAIQTLISHIANVANPHSVTKTQVGLGNVDNTSDANKPISNATQTALNLKANNSDLATVAKSGSYTDLTNKPKIPVNSDFTLSGLSDTTITTLTSNQILQYNGAKWVNANPQSFSQQQANWNENDTASVQYIQNKPTSLPANGGNADTVGGKHASDLQNYNNLTNTPTKLSDFQNDLPLAGFSNGSEGMTAQVSKSYTQLGYNQYASNSTYQTTPVTTTTIQATHWNVSSQPIEIAFKFGNGEKKIVNAINLALGTGYGFPACTILYLNTSNVLTILETVSVKATNETIAYQINSGNIASNVWVIRLSGQQWINVKLCNILINAQNGLMSLSDKLNLDSLPTEITTKAPLYSPNLSGTPTAPTATKGTATTQVATTAFVNNALSDVGGGTTVVVSATRPTGLKQNDLWYKII